MRESLTGHNGSLLAETARTVDDIVTRTDCLSDPLFTGLLEILAMPELHSSENAATFLKIFEYNMGFLPEEQAAAVQAALEEHYGSFTDPAACILVCEIVVDNAPPDAALETLLEFSQSLAETPRAIAVAGLRYLLKKSPPEDVAVQAVKRLTAMRADRSPVVRQEAEDALRWAQAAGATAGG